LRHVAVSKMDIVIQKDNETHKELIKLVAKVVLAVSNGRADCILFHRSRETEWDDRPQRRGRGGRDGDEVITAWRLRGWHGYSLRVIWSARALARKLLHQQLLRVHERLEGRLQAVR
jgi:hypothetical protein